jgi:hypothetical protein
MPMSDQQRNRAARLLAMAINARREGHFDYAERFTQRASEILNHPTALEGLGTQGGEKITLRRQALRIVVADGLSVM